jgi:hypothetical protein
LEKAGRPEQARGRFPVQEPARREALMTLVHAEPGADATAGVTGTVTLADGRTLTVRTVTSADVEGLDALFEGLSDQGVGKVFLDGG